MLITLVNAVLNPETCVPPSIVLILFTKEYSFAEKPSLYCIAISISIFLDSLAKYIGVTGKSNGDGNGTNSVGGNSNTAYMTYRGIENFYGNVWKWVDGFNINGGIPYVSNTDTDFADDTATGGAGTYSRLTDINGDGITLPQGSDDWQKNLQQIKEGLLPLTLVGASNTYITDYYYQAAGWRVATFGGDAYRGLLAGVASWFLDSGSADDHFNFGGRLCR